MIYVGCPLIMMDFGSTPGAKKRERERERGEECSLFAYRTFYKSWLKLEIDSSQCVRG